MPANFWDKLQPHRTVQPGGIKEVMKSSVCQGILVKAIRMRGWGDYRNLQQEYLQFAGEMDNYLAARQGLSPEFLPLSLFTSAVINGEERHVILQEYLQGVQLKTLARQCSSDVEEIRRRLFQDIGRAPACLPQLIEQLQSVETFVQNEDGSITQRHLTDCDWIITPETVKLIDCGLYAESLVNQGQRQIVTAYDQLAALFGLKDKMSDYLRQ